MDINSIIPIIIFIIPMITITLIIDIILISALIVTICIFVS